MGLMDLTPGDPEGGVVPSRLTVRASDRAAHKLDEPGAERQRERSGSESGVGRPADNASENALRETPFSVVRVVRLPIGENAAAKTEKRFR